jgi:hypothetical protein
LDHDRRRALAAQGRAAVEKICSPRAHCEKILRILAEPQHWESQALLASLFPFFNLHYDPGGKRARVELFNRYTRMVSREPWYREWVTPCERKGLVFP